MTEGTKSIAVDLPCLACGYNLRTLPVQARCPECGSPVRKSLESAILWGANHLPRLIRCAIWIAVTAIAMPVMLAGGYVVMLWLREGLMPNPHMGPNEFAAYIFKCNLLETSIWIPVMALAVVHVVAIWRGTRPPHFRKLGPPEILMRVGTLMFLIAICEPAPLWINDRKFVFRECWRRPQGGGGFAASRSNIAVRVLRPSGLPAWTKRCLEFPWGDPS